MTTWRKSRFKKEMRDQSATSATLSRFATISALEPHIASLAIALLDSVQDILSVTKQSFHPSLDDVRHHPDSINRHCPLVRGIQSRHRSRIRPDYDVLQLQCLALRRHSHGDLDYDRPILPSTNGAFLNLLLLPLPSTPACSTRAPRIFSKTPALL